jgi:uncharacterized protein YjeT (DUF2065 family)
MASFFLFIKNINFKIINFLIGKTPLFIFILGWFLIITGLLFLTQPEQARRKMLSQGFGVVIGFVRFAAIYVALLLLGLGWRFSHILPKIISMGLVVVLIKIFFMFKKKTFKKFEEKFALIPLPALKTYAWIQVIVGTLMVMLGKRIW